MAITGEKYLSVASYLSKDLLSHKLILVTGVYICCLDMGAQTDSLTNETGKWN